MRRRLPESTVLAEPCDPTQASVEVLREPRPGVLGNDADGVGLEDRPRAQRPFCFSVGEP